jgi:alkanesulfonate monooxygenase SsuD/methylene tetrahydromethanopterin reductase-like flavin-dependent oxidoreductase (luciferase family)
MSMEGCGVDVGLLTLGDLVTDPLTGARRTHAERHRNIVDQAVLAEATGFTSIHVGEHHFCDYIVSSPPVVLAAIAERTTTLRLSTGVALGVNLDPVRVAEDYATVDVLSGGRVEPCIGRGTFFPHTFAAFGQDPHDAHAMFAEHLELLLALWTEDEVRWSGSFRAPLNGLAVSPRPVQVPRPPIWLGAGASATSVELAARLGLRLMLPTVFGTPEMFAPMVELYEERWEHYGHDPHDRRIGCVSHAHVRKDSAEARSRWEPRYRAYLEWVNELQSRSSEGRHRGLGPFDFEALCRNTALCGSPAEVLDRMEVIRDLLHLDTHVVMLDMGGLPDDELFSAIELIGSEVIPAVVSAP